MNVELDLALIGAGALALVGGFSARRHGWGVALMYAGVIVLLGTALKMVVGQMA
ncbi:MAG TPA: hypothetical protein PLO07_11170 [Rubrivivax sp.]|nr:hypothetical protein [Rubrivivax sp.]